VVYLRYFVSILFVKINFLCGFFGFFFILILIRIVPSSLSVVRWLILMIFIVLVILRRIFVKVVVFLHSYFFYIL